MSIVFHCNHCGQKLEVAEEWLGSQAVCPSCKNNIIIGEESKAEDDFATTEPNNSLAEEAKTGNNKNDEYYNEINVQKNKKQASFLKKQWLKHPRLYIVLAVVLLLVGGSIPGYVIFSTILEKTNEKKEKNTVNFTCHFYSNRNEKIIPFCEIIFHIPIGKNSAEFVAITNMFYTNVQNELNARQKLKKYEYNSRRSLSDSKKYIDDLDVHLKILADLKDSLDQHIAIKEQLRLLPMSYESFRDGQITFSNVHNGEHVIYARAAYGHQRFIWVLHIEMKDNPIEILLTNDHKCHIFDEKDVPNFP